MNENYDDIIIKILGDILHTKHINYSQIMEMLQKLTNSKTGQFFEIVGSICICKYTSNDQFRIGQQYPVDGLPSNMYTIYQASDPVAIIILENIDKLVIINSTFNTLLDNTIAVALLVKNFQHKKYTLVKSFCIDINKNLKQILQETNRNSTLYKSTFDLFSKVQYVSSYTDVDTGNLIITNQNVSVKQFFDKIFRAFSSGIIIQYTSIVPINLIFDEKNVQFILFLILKDFIVTNKYNVNLDISLDDYGVDSIFLNIKITSNIFIIDKWKMILEKGILDIDTLTIFLAKEMCESLKGEFKIEENSINIRFKVNKTQ